MPIFSQAGPTSNHPEPALPLHHLVLMKLMLIFLTLEGAASLLPLGCEKCASHVGFEVECDLHQQTSMRIWPKKR